MINGKKAGDAILANGTVVERKAWRSLRRLRSEILRQARLDVVRYSKTGWTSGRGGVRLKGAFEFHVDMNAIDSKARAALGREKLDDWARDLQRTLIKRFKAVKGPKGRLRFRVRMVAINDSLLRAAH